MLGNGGLGHWMVQVEYSDQGHQWIVGHKSGMLEDMREADPNIVKVISQTWECNVLDKSRRYPSATHPLVW